MKTKKISVNQPEEAIHDCFVITLLPLLVRLSLALESGDKVKMELVRKGGMVRVKFKI